MGFYLRKSIRVGPLRFNFSKSGIGASAGIKGLRLGTGPRGNYVHVGGGGVYFRQTLSRPTAISPPLEPAGDSSAVAFTEIESGSTEHMVDSTSAALLAEINAKCKKAVIWPWITFVALGIVAGMISRDVPSWAVVAVAPLLAATIILAFFYDKLRKTIVCFYDLESHVEDSFKNLHTAFEQLRSCAKLWHIESKGRISTTHDWKVNSGAGHLVKRQNTACFFGAPPYFACNVPIPVLAAGRQKLYFFPDRLLVWDTAGVGAVTYTQLELGISERKFIEEESIPRDSQVIGKTWRYVNKKGGPDKRFRNNHEIPIVLYEELLFTSLSGLQELFQISRSGTGAILNSALSQMRSALSVPPPIPIHIHYLNCECNHCQGSIEFPADGLGITVPCPHCGLQTTLRNTEE